MANTAVAAVKKGCALYKEYKALGHEVHEVATDIGQHLGSFFKAQDEMERHAEKEKEKSKKNPSDSLNQQALDRVLAQKRLEQMETDLRQVLVYESPPELGSLYKDFIAARKQILVEQEAYKEEQERLRKEEARRSRLFWDKWNIRIAIAIGVLLVALEFTGLMYWLHHDYQQWKSKQMEVRNLG